MENDFTWVKLYRRVENNPLYFAEPFTRYQAWQDLFGFANHKDNYFFVRGIKVNVKRGQTARSKKTLAKRWKWNYRKVNNFLKFLEKEQMIHTRITNVTTIITIVNYEMYQGSADQITYQMQTRLQTNKNDKNERSNNRKNIVTTERKQSLTPNQLKEKTYLHLVVSLLMLYSGKEKSSAYALIHKLLKLKAEDELSYLRKCLMLMYVIRLNVEKVNEQKYVGILVNQYRELSYNIVKDQMEKQREMNNELETLN